MRSSQKCVAKPSHGKRIPSSGRYVKMVSGQWRNGAEMNLQRLPPERHLGTFAGGEALERAVEQVGEVEPCGLRGVHARLGRGGEKRFERAGVVRLGVVEDDHVNALRVHERRRGS